MTTRKQGRANRRIQYAKERKEQRFYRFVVRLAKRRRKNADRSTMRMNFCCFPERLGMSRDSFLSMGQQLVGGKAVFYDAGVLRRLLPWWRCHTKVDPHVLMASYVKKLFNEDGKRRRAQL